VTKILFSPVVPTATNLTEVERAAKKRQQAKLRNRIDSEKRVLERLIAELNEVNDALGETPGQDETKRICGND
jgi:hypothetical protein